MYLPIFRGVCTCLCPIFSISTVSALKALLQEIFPCQILHEEKSFFLYAKVFHGLEIVVLSNSNFESIVISIMI